MSNIKSAMEIVKITPSAISRLRKIIAHEQCKSILFSIKGGGCSGFEYKLEPNNNKAEKIDEVIKKDGIELHVCGKSLMHVLGTEIDWKDDIMGSYFRFNNPNASAQCGCGTSFSTSGKF